MRTRFLALPLALLLALASAGIAAADTTPGGGGSEGGLDVAVTAVTVNTRTGLATVSGLVTCEVDFDWIGVEVGLTQPVGRLFTIRGWGYGGEGGCAAADGTVPFSAQLYAESGRFAPGRGSLEITAYGEGGCVEDPETGDVYCETWGWASHGPMPVRLQAQR